MLRFQGDQPVRLLGRGPVVIASGGRIDVSGGSPAPHDSTIALPEAGVTLVRDGNMILQEPVPPPLNQGGPAAGDGGFGGDRHDHTGNTSIIQLRNSNPRSDASWATPASPRARQCLAPTSAFPL